MGPKGQIKSAREWASNELFHDARSSRRCYDPAALSSPLRGRMVRVGERAPGIGQTLLFAFWPGGPECLPDIIPIVLARFGSVCKNTAGCSPPWGQYTIANSLILGVGDHSAMTTKRRIFWLASTGLFLLVVSGLSLLNTADGQVALPVKAQPGPVKIQPFPPQPVPPQPVNPPPKKESGLSSFYGAVALSEDPKYSDFLAAARDFHQGQGLGRRRQCDACHPR